MGIYSAITRLDPLFAAVKCKIIDGKQVLTKSYDRVNIKNTIYVIMKSFKNDTTMKKSIFILIVSVTVLFMACDQAINNESTTNSLDRDTMQLSNKIGDSYLKIKTDTLSSDINDVKLIIVHHPYSKGDYITEYKSDVLDTSKYATDRGINKGQIHFPCKNKSQHDYKIPIQKNINIVSIKYDMAVYDKTDYVFTQDTIFEIHTFTSNAGIFTDSDVKFNQNDIDISSNKKTLRTANIKCSFNNYLYDMVLNFCQENNIKIK